MSAMSAMKLRDLKNKIMPIIEDALWAESALDREDNKFTRRAYIRSLFSMIEGTVWILKQTVLVAPVRGGGPKRFSPAEYALLSDKTYDLDRNGEPKEQVKFLKLPENVKFTFNIFSKYFGTNLDLGIGSNGWNKFLEAQKVRNRITHPKTPEEFDISDEEIQSCKTACSWFNFLVANTLSAIVSTHEKPAMPRKNHESLKLD